MERSVTHAEVQTGGNRGRSGEYPVPDHPLHVLSHARRGESTSQGRPRHGGRRTDGRSAKTSDPPGGAARPANARPTTKTVKHFAWKVPLLSQREAGS